MTEREVAIERAIEARIKLSIALQNLPQFPTSNQLTDLRRYGAAWDRYCRSTKIAALKIMMDEKTEWRGISYG